MSNIVGAFLYHTRDVRLDSTYAVARLCAQLAEGLSNRPGFSINVFQEASLDCTEPERHFDKVSVRNGRLAKVVSRSLKPLRLRKLGSRLRLAAWYGRAASAISPNTSFVLTCAAISVSWLRRRLPRMPIVLWIHDVPDIEENFLGLTSADLVVTASEYVRKRIWEGLKDKGCPMMMSVIPNMVDDGSFFPASQDERVRYRRHFGVPVGSLVFGFASSFGKHKGLHILLRAMALLGRAGRWNRSGIPWLLVAGDGQDINARPYKELAESLGVRMTFTGRLNPPELRCFYCCVDLMAVPSLWAEPFGLVALESLLCGTPTFVSATGGLREICREEANAVLVKCPNMPRAWAEAFAGFIESGVSAGPERPSHLSTSGFIDRWVSTLGECVIE